MGRACAQLLLLHYCLITLPAAHVTASDSHSKATALSLLPEIEKAPAHDRGGDSQAFRYQEGSSAATIPSGISSRWKHAVLFMVLMYP